MHHQTLIQKYQAALEAEATEQTKEWWEKYMKGIIPFRGVGIPRNRALLATWRKENGIDQWSAEQQLALALAFFREPIAEDKLAGILFMQNFLYNKLPWQMLLDKCGAIYQEKLIFDWSICDWFCIRVLGAMIKKHGDPCAMAIANWKHADYLWQARSSVVPFVNLTATAKYYPYIHDACTVLINREERFAKTAVGWILRDVSRHDEHFVMTFIENHLASFSRESLANALKYFGQDKKNQYLQARKKA